MFFNPHLRGFIDAAANLLSQELPEWKCSMSLPMTAAIVSMDATACEHSEDTISLENVSLAGHTTESSMRKGHQFLYSNYTSTSILETSRSWYYIRSKRPLPKLGFIPPPPVVSRSLHKDPSGRRTTSSHTGTCGDPRHVSTWC